jgi:dTDP-N-acetylfucosamine:lipid II N-acetylfucosaminyltransferase
MNYHLMVDDKFIDHFIDSAELVSPNKNIYIFTFTKPAKFVKSKKGIFALPLIIDSINGDDRLYIHWFDKYMVEIVNKLPVNISIYLFFWGGDFLQQTSEFYNFNFEPLTKKYLLKIELKSLLQFHLNPIGYLKNINRYFIAQRQKREIEYKELEARKILLSKLKYFCHWNHRDMDRVFAAYGGSPIILHFIYDVSLNKISKPTYGIKAPHRSTNIWLGNSDDPTNNHLDAMRILLSYKDENIKLICPLNYNNWHYEKHITEKGRMYFKEKWQSITEFIPITQYLSLLETADVVVMYHNLTQAAGNIFSFVKMGKKVYLKKQSTIFSLLVENGIKIFDANTIKELTFEEFSKPLSYEEIEMNYHKISLMFSDEQRLFSLSKILN